MRPALQATQSRDRVLSATPRAPITKGDNKQKRMRPKDSGNTVQRSNYATRLVVMAYVHVNRRAHRGLVKMVLFLDTKGNHATIAEKNSRVANRPIPAPAALVPCCLLVNPLFGGDAVEHFGGFAERRADGSHYLILRHPDCDVRGSLSSSSTSAKP